MPAETSTPRMRPERQAKYRRSLFGRRVHLLGILGSGMRSLASLLLDAGVEVSGSDASESETSKLPPDVKFHSGHAVAYLPPEVDCLIYSDAIDADNPERLAARRRRIEQISYPAALGRLTRNRATTAVAGTHGKSTTAAVLSHLLRSAGRDPSYCFGASFADGSPGGRWGGGDEAVIEACEFRRNFLQLTPRAAIVTNIDQDHFDCYPDESATLAAFRQFLGKVPTDGLRLLQLAAADKLKSTAPLETFDVEGTSQGRRADWLATNVALHADGSRFRLQRGDTLAGEFQSPLRGRHNVANAAAAIIAALASGLTCREAARHLATFPGVRRRLELIRRHDGIVHFDDYAHHPTAIAATIAALRQCYADRRIVALFQPHQATRVERLFDDFVRALSAADAVAILEVCRAREPAGLYPEISGRLAEALQAKGVHVLPGRSWHQAWPACLTACREGDVLVTMSAGHLGKDRYERN